MASIEQLKAATDLHRLAEYLGLVRPGGRGNYRSPHHDDSTPSLSVYDGGAKWKDFSSDGAGGDALDLIAYVRGCDQADAIRELHEFTGLPKDAPRKAEARDATLVEFIAERCLTQPERALEYLTGRGISEQVVRAAIRRRTVGFNDYTGRKAAAGEFGYGGPAAAFIVRSMNPGQVLAVDMRYLDPALNGGVKTMTQGEKEGCPWTSDHVALAKAHTVVIVESAINALSVETAGLRRTAAIATRGTATVKGMSWAFLAGKRVLVCMDNDEPNDKGHRPGPEAAWALHEALTSQNIATHIVDQREWTVNDVNDLLQAEGAEGLRAHLKPEPWAIAGFPGDDSLRGRPRVFLPAHHFAQYWRFRVKDDFTNFVKKREEDEGGEKLEFEDVCGFRVAALSRIRIASPTATMAGGEDAAPRTVYAVAVQSEHHGRDLDRRVMEKERLFDPDQWKRFGAVYNRTRFMRLINILAFTCGIGERTAANFVGLAWRDGKLAVNEGPDCFFTDPHKQCPYHNLRFPVGPLVNARRVIRAYQGTFKRNAASQLLAWSLGGHLKALLGFWPHLTLQADKGKGKSTLTGRLQQTIGFKMLSGQSLQTEFRLLTSVAHTSHPVGWAEISARRQQTIDAAVSMLQESYTHSITYRNTDMTEYLLSAPVLLEGEDVPVQSLTGKVVRVELEEKGEMLPMDLPTFPVRGWLEHLAKQDRGALGRMFERAQAFCRENCSAGLHDNGAERMVTNYAALLTAWRLLTSFAGIEREEEQGFVQDLLRTMNRHIAETVGDREPWVWIMEVIFGEISAGHYRHPYKIAIADEFGYEEHCLLLRTSHVVQHLRQTPGLRDVWNALPVKSDRVLKRQMKRAGVVYKERMDPLINGHREAHMVALSIPKLKEFGLLVGLPHEMDRV